MTLQDRCDAFALAHPRYPDAWPRVSPSGRWLYAVWETGNNYRSHAPLYGAYPPRLLGQILALFPDHAADRTLHAFSGSLPAGRHVRLDLNPALRPDVVGDVRSPPFADRAFGLVLADTPYSPKDAERYAALLPPGSASVEDMMPDRAAVTRALARLVPAGGHLAWLDTQWPMHRKREWRTFGRIFVQGSTNHRVRALSLFERVA